MTMRPTCRNLVAILMVVFAAPALAQNAKVAGKQFTSGAAATNLGTLQASPTDIAYGAKCDGATTDSSSFSAAITAANLVVLPPELTCVVGNLTITNGQTLDCNGSILKAAPGATWIVKKTGFRSSLRNCIIYDPNAVTMQTTTLSALAAPGATVLSVVSATTFQVNMVVTVQLASGAYWTTKIVGVNTGTNQITIADPIPFTVTAATVAAGGSGYVTAHEFISLGGIGAPATFNLTAVAGVLTGVTSIDAPGMFQTSPGSPIAVTDPLTPAAFNGTLNITYAGASAGAFVDAAFGVVLIDAATNGDTSNIIVPTAPVALEVMSAAGQTTQESIRHFESNGSQIAGVVKLQGVSNVSFREIRLYGTTHHASAYGAVGFYIDGDTQTFASGGNAYDITALNFETGLLDINGTLDIFDRAVLDTTRNYNLLCFGCTSSDWTYMFAAFTGPNAISGSAGRGIGAYFGSNAANNTIGKLTTNNNASDVHLGDQTSSVWINNVAWAPSKIMTGYGNSLYSPNKVFAVGPSAVGTLASPQYLSPGVVSATQTAAYTLAGLRGQLTGMIATSALAPGADTYQALLEVNHWTGSAYAGWNAVAGCTWTGIATACSLAHSGVSVVSQDQVQIAITTTGAIFAANQIISAFVNGI